MWGIIICTLINEVLDYMHTRSMRSPLCGASKCTLIFEVLEANLQNLKTNIFNFKNIVRYPYNFWQIFFKLSPHNLNKNLRWPFSQILINLLQWRHNGFFCVLFSPARSRLQFSFIFFQIKTNFALQLIALHGIKIQRFWFIPAIQNDGSNNS